MQTSVFVHFICFSFLVSASLSDSFDSCTNEFTWQSWCVIFHMVAQVLFSENFRKSFVKLNTSRLRKSVLNLLVKLASGWRPKRQNVDSLCESSSQIVKQFKVEGWYVICSIDIQKESTYTQVLRVWDVLHLEEVAKLLKRLDNIFSMYTDEFINLCKEKCLEG